MYIIVQVTVNRFPLETSAYNTEISFIDRDRMNFDVFVSLFIGTKHRRDPAVNCTKLLPLYTIPGRFLRVY